MLYFKKIKERLKNKRYQKYLKNKRLKTQLINEVTKILKDIDYDNVENDNDDDDKYFVINKGDRYQFSMSIENEFVEFYSNEKNQVIGSYIENYVEQVKSTLIELLEGKHWSQAR